MYQRHERREEKREEKKKSRGSSSSVVGGGLKPKEGNIKAWKGQKGAQRR